MEVGLVHWVKSVDESGPGYVQSHMILYCLLEEYFVLQFIFKKIVLEE